MSHIVARVPLPPDHEWRKTQHNTQWPNPWALYCKGELVRAASRFERELLDAKVQIERTGDESGRDTRSLAHREGDEVVLRLSIDALVYATENHIDYHPEMGGPTLKVTDREAWAKSFIRALNDEQEDGSTSFMRLIDKAIRKAVDDGEEGVELIERKET